MANDGLHDLFTVFTFKTPPSGDFLYMREQNRGLSRRDAPSRRASPTLSFWNCAQNQIVEPVWMGDSRAIRSKRFDRGIHPEIAVRAVGVLPALMPVERCFDSRITGAKQVQTLFDPRRFADSAGWRCGKRKFAGRPFRNHDGLV